MKTLKLFAFIILFHVTSLYAQFDNVNDYLGRPITFYANYYLNDAATSNYDAYGNPVVYYNPTILARYSFQSQMFIYYHECGHHFLGHLKYDLRNNIPYYKEQEADCFSINYLVRNKNFGSSDIQIIQNEMLSSPGDWTHLPGPARANNLPYCLH